MHESKMVDPELKPLGDRIRELRRRRGWSQSELARKAGISKTRVWTLEQGQLPPSFPTLRGLAQAFGLSVSELMDTSKPLRKLEDLPLGKVIGRVS